MYFLYIHNKLIEYLLPFLKIYFLGVNINPTGANFFPSSAIKQAIIIAHRKNVMKLHFMNLVGFVPLCISSHENYHSQILDIPIDVCEGGWKDLDHYFYIPEHISDDIKRKAGITFSTARSKDEWKVRGNLFQLNKNTTLDIKQIDTSDWS